MVKHNRNTEAELERRGDLLLRQAHALNKQAGCYSEKQLLKQRQRRQDAEFDEARVRATAEHSLQGIAWRSIRESLKRSHCPARQAECMRLWLLGYSHREIAELPHIVVCYRTVGNDIRAALRLLKADSSIGIIEVLAEVFGLSAAHIEMLLAD